MTDLKYVEMKGFLNQKCLVYPTVLMTLHNLVNIHFAFNDEKIAINYYIKDHCKPFSHQPNELQKLGSKILRYENWEILDLSEKDFEDWRTQEKVDEIKGWLIEAKDRQIKKGVLKIYEDLL